jgi:tetratricopeptide (TPR) repeat protein
LFREAARLDPDLPEAQIWLARVSAGVVAYGWSENPEGDLAEGLQAALRAIQLDDRNAYSHYGLAIVSVYSGALEQAMRAAEMAVKISPSFALGHLVLGMARLFAGSAAEAITPLEYGLRLSPYDPQNFVWYNILALSHLFTGQPSRARDIAGKALQVRPAWRTTLETLVACHAALNEWDRARDCLREIQKLEPMPGDVLAPMRTRNPAWAAQLADSLRQAESLGIPPGIV